MIHFTVSNLVLLQRFTGLCSRIYVYVYLLKELFGCLWQIIPSIIRIYSRHNVLLNDEKNLTNEIIKHVRKVSWCTEDTISRGVAVPFRPAQVHVTRVEEKKNSIRVIK